MNIEDVVGPANAVPTCCSVHMTLTKGINADGVEELWHCRVCNHTKRRKPFKPGVQGEVTIQLIDAKTGEIVHEINGNNIFTDVGRNYLAALISYLTLGVAGAAEPATSKRRYDGVRYMMVGKGSQNETNAVSQLDDPVPFNAAGHFLAQISAPNELPGSGISAVFQRVYGANEISMPTTVDITEVGLYFSGPAGAELALGDKFAAPIAYHVFPAIPKTAAFLFSVRWEIKF